MVRLLKLIIPLGLAVLPYARWRGWPLALVIILALLLGAAFLWLNLLPTALRGHSRRLRALAGGYRLIVLASWFMPLAIILHLLWWLIAWPGWAWALASAAISLLISGTLLANGFIRLAATSFALGLKLRLALILLWWVPVINLFVLVACCRRARRELHEELARDELDEQRKASALCQTRYPLLLVHGIFFRDWQLANYWGRIPAALTRNGATIYYGQQQSAASVALSGQQLALRIQEVLALSGAEKVNIIAHSKGGLDARWAIAHAGVGDKVASLTTICTPHQGCAFVDRWLRLLPQGLIGWVSRRYNRIFTLLGDEQPDFMAGVRDLTQAACINRDAALPEGIFCQSRASRIRNMFSASFPMNIATLLIKDGANDGLVTVDSARWGAEFGLVEPVGRRGISHADMIDLSRQDIPGFDVREYYVGLVNGLKQRGL